MRDVARRAGVCVATVSRVLNENPSVSPELRARVLEAINECGYQRDRVARSLRVRHSQIIGLVISDIQNPFFTSVVRGVEDVAYESGYTVLLCNSDEDPDKERLYIDVMLAEKVAGVIISPTAETGNYARVLLEQKVPVVSMDRRMLDLDVDTVVVDNVAGAYQAVSHLLAMGHRRVAFIGGPLSTTTGRERLEGYQKALDNHGVPRDQNLIKIGGFKQQGGLELTCQLLAMAEPPSALFTGNNLLTLGVLNCLHEKGLSVPRDLALVGFDDMPWAQSLDPPLTAVAQPTHDLGRTAAELLLRRIANRDAQTAQVILQPTLVVRRSCGYDDKASPGMRAASGIGIQRSAGEG